MAFQSNPSIGKSLGKNKEKVCQVTPLRLFSCALNSCLSDAASQSLYPPGDTPQSPRLTSKRIACSPNLTGCPSDSLTTLKA